MSKSIFDTPVEFESSDGHMGESVSSGNDPRKLADGVAAAFPAFEDGRFQMVVEEARANLAELVALVVRLQEERDEQEKVWADRHLSEQRAADRMVRAAEAERDAYARTLEHIAGNDHGSNAEPVAAAVARAALGRKP